MKNKALYLFFTAAILLLTLGFVHVQELRRDLDQRMLEHIREMQELLDQANQQNSNLRQQEEQARLHYVKAEQRQILSRSGRPSLAILSPSGFTAGDFEAALAGTGLEGIGAALVAAEEATGVNALALAGICALESGWGTSALAREKNNLAGLGAYDGDEYRSAIRFESRGACVMALAELIADGGSLEEVGRWYASDPAWAPKVAGCMRMIGGADQ